MTESCRLYLISPPNFFLDDFEKQLLNALSGGDVACFQLRLKDTDDNAIRDASKRLMPICRNYDVAFLINDRPDLAAEMGADGVHVGSDDVTYEVARRIVGSEATVGVSCYNSRHLAILAGEQGADYVAFGAFYPTKTKEARTHVEPNILSWWQETTTIPSVAIGGINTKNCGALIKAGANFLAIISGVWDHKYGPTKAINLFHTEMEKYN